MFFGLSLFLFSAAVTGLALLGVFRARRRIRLQRAWVHEAPRSGRAVSRRS